MLRKIGRHEMKKKIFINQQKLESSLINGQIILDGSILRSDDINGYYQLIPAIKFTACVSNPEDPLGYTGKCAALAIFEQKGVEVNMHSIDYKGETYEVDEGFLGDHHQDAQSEDDWESEIHSENGVKYDPYLIKKLNNDHKALTKFYDEIMEAASEDKYDIVTTKLNSFVDRLRIHLMTEQIKFYNYLEHVFKNNELTKTMNKSFQDRIKVIGQKAIDFIDKYENIDWNDETKQTFVKEIENLDKILAERATMEEDLYELYLPKSAYNGTM